MSTSKAVTPSPIRVSAGTMSLARAEAALSGRSLSSQVDYWARLGHAIEHSPAFDRNRVNAALAGQLGAEVLNDEETEVFLSQLGEAMETIETPSGAAFWVKLRTEGGGVGMDDDGRLVRGRPDGTVEVLKKSV
jgi:hypothetical protein